ncbi:MAG: EAL domain-containing protein [Eubacteriales bacterium]|nr:EAL domain-containing protein [Eubacteriales bacterium]
MIKKENMGATSASVNEKRMQEETLTELEKNSIYLGATTAFARNYMIVFLVTLSKNTAQFVKKEGYLPESLRISKDNTIPYEASAKLYVESRVYEKDRERVEEFLAIENVERSMASKDEISICYRVTADEGLLEFQAKIIKSEQEDTYILGFQNIENEKNTVYDELTGIFNKQYFYEYTNRLLYKAEEKGQVSEYSVLFNNIKNFKYYNMKYGHQAGDMLLQHVAKSIESVGSDLMVARFGDDHFISISKDPMVVETVRNGNHMFDEEFEPFGIKLKTGIYQLRTGDASVETAGELAKFACDSIMETSDSVALYDEKLEKQLERNNHIEKNFEEALRNGHIKVYYQPVIRTLNGQFCGAEALARWSDPELGLLSPGDFIPVLEQKQLITRFDLYILRQICRDIREGIRNRDFPVPVSLNLSKADFVKGDIFETIDQIVLGYKVPRDLIRIEITESVVVTDPRHMKRVIAQFHETGYQVWMDDFGSQLSSLNLLNEYNFDEIKLDIMFLKSFDDRSKELIRSVVQMAKRLGIQTLAEGVETKEQYEYLRGIGCEKVQGYYFSRPRPIRELAQYRQECGTKVEQRVMWRYYDKIGQIDYITDRTLAIVESDTKSFRIVYMNPEFKKICTEIGDGQNFVTDYILNSPSSTLHRKFWELQMSTYDSEEFAHMDFYFNGKYFRVRSKCITRCGQYTANQLEIQNITVDELERKGESMDQLFRMMYSMYDSVCFLSEDGVFSNVMLKQTPGREKSDTGQKNTLRFNREKVGEQQIFWEDQREFMEFTDPHRLKNRLKETERGYETRYFRTKTQKGAYVWKEHTVQCIPENDMLLYSTRPAYFYQKGLMERLAPAYMEEYQMGRKGLLCAGFFSSDAISLFWKDSNRRFLGVNKKFLDTYGLASDETLIGKTDEEMKWHINDASFFKDETDVLENGTAIRNRIEKCIIKGTLHTLLTTREPMYQDGRIVGIMGYFIDLDEAEDIKTKGIVDSVTGLLSVQGMTDAVARYMEGWNSRREHFALIGIVFRESERAYRTYGEDITKQMVAEIGSILVKLCGDQCCIARLYAGKFSILKKYRDKSEIVQLAETIRADMKSVRQLAGYSATVNPEIYVEYAAETANEHQLMSLATGGVFLEKGQAEETLSGHYGTEAAKEARWEKKQRRSSEFKLEDIWSTYEELGDIFYAADMDTHELLYMNRKGREIIGVHSTEDIIGKKCYEVIQGKTSPCEFCTNRQLMSEQVVEYDFFNPKHDVIMHIRDQRIVHGKKNIRIEHAVELDGGTGTAEKKKSDHVLAVINESIRMSLEEQDPDRGIEKLIEYLGEVLHAERTYLFEATSDGEAWTNTYEWCASGVTAEKDFLAYVPQEDTALWNREFEKGNYIKIRDVEMIKESDPTVYEYLIPQNIRSLIVSPIYQAKQLYGFVGFDNPPKEMLDILSDKIQLVSHVLASILERRILKEKLDEIIFKDGMTGLGNRHAVDRFFDELDSEESIGVVFCDVCGLKYVNDNLGHLSGDALVTFARDMIVETFPGCNIFRWGGDEMLILVQGIEKNMFFRYSARLKELSLKNNAPIAVGAVWKERADSSEDEFIKEADKMMYIHKKMLYQHYDIHEMLMKNTLIVQ